MCCVQAKAYQRAGITASARSGTNSCSSGKLHNNSIWIKHIINNIISNNIRFYEQRTTNTTCKHKSKQQKSILYYSTRIPECVQHLHDNNQSPVAALRSNSSCANMPWGAASSVGAAPQGARFTPSMLIHVACVNRCRQSMRWPAAAFRSGVVRWE